MDLGLYGKVALVTGASRGIGKAVAKTLIQEGCQVAICARGAERLHAAVADLSHGKNGHENRRVLGISTDVTNEAAVQELVAKVHRAFGRIDILVNNAGTHLRGTVDTTTAEILERQLRDKVFGFFHDQSRTSDHAGAKGWANHQYRRSAARHPHPDRFPSGVTNAACMALTKSVADAVARENIRVNAVCPQYIESELLASLIEKEMRERKVDRTTAAGGFSRANPLGRTGTPDEVADLVCFLASRIGELCDW